MVENSPNDRTIAMGEKCWKAGQKDGAHVSSVLGSALSQVRPRSPQFATRQRLYKEVLLHRYLYLYVFFWFGIHTASVPSTAETRTILGNVTLIVDSIYIDFGG